MPPHETEVKPGTATATPPSGAASGASAEQKPGTASPQAAQLVTGERLTKGFTIAGMVFSGILVVNTTYRMMKGQGFWSALKSAAGFGSLDVTSGE